MVLEVRIVTRADIDIPDGFGLLTRFLVVFFISSHEKFEIVYTAINNNRQVR